MAIRFRLNEQVDEWCKTPPNIIGDVSIGACVDCAPADVS
jgi:hypothetical protein